jgi:hypothetical protein
MPGPLLPLVAAGIGAKLLLWNKRGVILKHVLRRQALAAISQMEIDRLRLYRSHRKDFTDDATAEVYRVTCNGEDKFAPRFGIDMNIFAIAPVEATPYLVAIPATLASEMSFVKLDPVDILDADFTELMSAVRKEIDKMSVETEKPAPVAAKDKEEPVLATPKPSTTCVKSSTEKAVDVDGLAPEVAPTAGQAKVLKQAIETPGEVLKSVAPQSIGACERRGWIKLVGKKTDQLKNSKWRITDAGRTALAASET